jgi:hypothetical protein
MGLRDGLEVKTKWVIEEKEAEGHKQPCPNFHAIRYLITAYSKPCCE